LLEIALTLFDPIPKSNKSRDEARPHLDADGRGQTVTRPVAVPEGGGTITYLLASGAAIIVTAGMNGTHSTPGASAQPAYTSGLKPSAYRVPAGRRIPIGTDGRDYRVRETHEMKHRIVHTVQKFLLNPPIKLALAIGLPLPGYALLETKGRKTGKPRRTPVGDGRIGNEFWLVAEHGMKAGYVRNIIRDPHVRLKLREGFKIRWHTGTAHLLPDDSPRERQRWLATQLPSSAGNARAVRLFGTQLLSVRIDLDR